jgi:hypothetical protein
LNTNPDRLAQRTKRSNLSVAFPPADVAANSAWMSNVGRVLRGPMIVACLRRKSLRTSKRSGADHGVPKKARAKLSCWPSATPRLTHAQLPGSGNVAIV